MPSIVPTADSDFTVSSAFATNIAPQAIEFILENIQRLQRVVVGDLPDAVGFDPFRNECPNGDRNPIDDVFICWQTNNFGADGVIGTASISVVRGQSNAKRFLPIASTVTLNSAIFDPNNPVLRVAVVRNGDVEVKILHYYWLFVWL